MEHRLVFTMFAEERDVFAEVHVFEMIGDKTAVATLDAFAKFLQDLFFAVVVHKCFKILSHGVFPAVLAKGVAVWF